MKQDINNKIVNYLRKYDPLKIGLFGSYARGEETEQSDIDILVEFKKQITLFDLGEMKYDLTELLNRQVDIVTERAINKRIKDYIYKDLKIIFE